MFYLRCLIFALMPLTLQAKETPIEIPVPPTLAAKSWLLMEFSSGQILAAGNPDLRLEPASLTKLMTAYVVFSALHQKTLSLDQKVPVSTNAAKAGGSRMFLKPRESVLVDDLLKGMIVQSGNDASIALAEAISGTEPVFVTRMNQEATRLGMTNTRFQNATGLPAGDHFSTAHDLGLLAAALIRDFPVEYARYYHMLSFTYNKIRQPNRNRLLMMDASADGLKTGHTEAAGYCLISSSRRGLRRLVAVVMGTASDTARADESFKLLNWGFDAYQAIHLYVPEQRVTQQRVWKGQTSTVKAGFLQDVVIALPKAGPEHEPSNRIKMDLTPLEVTAPIRYGQAIGTLKITGDGQFAAQFPVVALEEVAPGNWLRRLWDSFLLWFY